MNKIIDIFDEEQVFDCMGCDIANEKLIPPGGYIYKDNLISISQDPEIPIVGFMILGIKKHVNSLNELTEEDRTRIMNILNTTIEKMKKIGLCEKVLIVQEERSSHFHIWIMPILPWMSKFNNSVFNIKDMIDYSKEIYNEGIKKEIINVIELLKKEFNN